MNILYESENQYVINLGTGEAYLQRKGPFTATEQPLEPFEKAMLVLIGTVKQQKQRLSEAMVLTGEDAERFEANMIEAQNRVPTEEQRQHYQKAKDMMDNLLLNSNFPVYSASQVRELLKQQRQNCAEAYTKGSDPEWLANNSHHPLHDIKNAKEPELKP